MHGNIELDKIYEHNYSNGSSEQERERERREVGGGDRTH
jgi:hypothetical protein